MVWDFIFQTHEEPNANEWECVMGFLIGITIAYDFTEGQRRFLIDQAIDFNTIL